MKNTILAAVACSFFLIAVLGCGSLNPLSDQGTSGSGTGSNKSLTDKGVDTVVGEETTGVPECDEVMNMIAEEANNPDDGYIAKAVKATFLNKLKESIRRGVEESKNQNSKADMAKTCADFKDQLIKYKAEQDAKK